MDECRKAVTRRMHQPGYATRYFVGTGIDIGAGPDNLGEYKQQFPRMTSCRGWDLPDGDAQFMQGIPDNTYDFVHSSHCLEHMRDPFEALKNWFRILRPNGFMVVMVPDEDLYEQGGTVNNGRFYSDYNGDHKKTMTIHKHSSWSPVSTNVFDLITSLGPKARVIKIELLDNTYQYGLPRKDQTLGIGECAIEFVVQKLP